MASSAGRVAFLLAVVLPAAACVSQPAPPVPSAQPAAAPLEPALDAGPSAASEPAFVQVGNASWYGRFHQGRPTASGARYDMNGLTAAHRTLPLGTAATVTNLENGRSVHVLVNDRGPYRQGRVIDLSRHAAELLGMKEQGIAKVRIEATPQKRGEETAAIDD
jgi:rare lipoprotein A